MIEKARAPFPLSTPARRPILPTRGCSIENRGGGLLMRGPCSRRSRREPAQPRTQHPPSLIGGDVQPRSPPPLMELSRNNPVPSTPDLLRPFRIPEFYSGHFDLAIFAWPRDRAFSGSLDKRGAEGHHPSALPVVPRQPSPLAFCPVPQVRPQPRGNRLDPDGAREPLAGALRLADTAIRAGNRHRAPHRISEMGGSVCSSSIHFSGEKSKAELFGQLSNIKGL